jgi:hypothetical protein
MEQSTHHVYMQFILITKHKHMYINSRIIPKKKKKIIVPSCCWRGFARHSLLSNPIDLLIKYLKWKHHNIFVENMSQGNTRWKIVSCDRTFTVVQLHIQQPAILNHWTSSSKNVHIISMATARKNRDLIADWCVMP